MEINHEYSEVYSDETLENINKEFSRLKDIAYLDHAGAALYSETQVQKISEDFCNNVYGNPHSFNSSSKLTSDLVSQVRDRILTHFKTDASKYDMIFTSGATGSLKAVAETFKWGNGGNFVYFSENHTSVVGLRGLAAKNGANTLSLTNDDVIHIFHKEKKLDLSNEGNSLFAYPAQCNFSGAKYPLEWIEKVQQGGLQASAAGHWAVMLDAASYVATSPLDLSTFSPDFVCLSFYKIFGLPTGLGALMVLKSSERFLDKVYFGGGTVLMARGDRREHLRRPDLHDWFEDGTISFLSIIALRHGFDTLSRLVPGGIQEISTHAFRLAQHLHHSLASMKHYNDKPVAKIYCDTDFEDKNKQGPIINFNLLRANGSYIGFNEVLHMCNLFGVHVRTGCFCNPGACQRHRGLSIDELEHHFEAGHVCGDSIDIVAGQPTGSVRASLGYCTMSKHVEKLLGLVRKCFQETAPQTETLATISSRPGEPHLCRLFLYPVKSCGAQDVQSWPLDSRGLVGDRAWMIATDAGVALTQKHQPRMCLIKPNLDLVKGTLTISFPDMDDISIPFIPKGPACEGSSKVCGARVQTTDCGDKVAEWLSLALEQSGLRLLRQWPTDQRMQKKGDAELSLANQAQFLLVGLGSLAWLERRVRTDGEKQEDEPVCEGEELLQRFRSNIVVSGVPEFEETKWQSIRIGNVVMKVCKQNAEGPCTRCQMVCISQSSGTKTTEPLRTLTAANQGRMQFGTYFSQVTPGTLYVGSRLSPITFEN
ncbi:hypothetical protein B566_EDAN011235 [Ephemera danica]|nr:hypothetical protein B566_EDAN011235 [Ephemera danica]